MPRDLLRGWIVDASQGSSLAKPILARAGIGLVCPGSSAILAQDPDIPEDSQRIRFLPSSAAEGLVWRVEEVAITAGPDGGASWVPRNGMFRLQLEDASGRVLDSLRFEVRGSVARLPSP